MANQPKNNAENSKNAPHKRDYRWLVFMGLIAFVIYLLSPILTPFLIAAVLAYICDPLVDWLSDTKVGNYSMGRTIATTLVLLGFLLAIVILFLILVPLLQKQSLLIVERLPVMVDNLRHSVEPWLQSKLGISMAIDSSHLQDIITKNWKTTGDIVSEILKTAGTQGLAFIGLLANLFLFPIVFFYLLRDWDELSVMLALCVFYSISLWLVGLDMALSIGLIAGLLSFVPYLGFALAFILAVLLAILQFSSFAEVVPVLIVFGLGQFIESFFLTPLLVGERIGLHPVIVILALLAGGQLFGFAGVLLALPVSAAIAVGLRHTKDNYLNSDAYLK
jgi:predicted PurR-regulated permease PerM